MASRLRFLSNGLCNGCSDSVCSHPPLDNMRSNVQLHASPPNSCLIPRLQSEMRPKKSVLHLYAQPIIEVMQVTYNGCALSAKFDAGESLI